MAQAQMTQTTVDVAGAIARVTESLRQMSPQHVQSIVDFVEYLRWQEEDEEDAGLELSAEALADIAAYRAGDTSRALSLEDAWKVLDGS
jgi:hypothetical protein